LSRSAQEPLWTKIKLKNLSDSDKRRNESRNGSELGRNVSSWVNREIVYPTNVLQFANVYTNKNHSAAFPEELPEWFIKLFTQPGDAVLDPFLDSGTTIKSAFKMGRNCTGIEIMPEYVEMLRTSMQIQYQK
jgi:site-specific DNA-methyltransferase (adenine-specific)/site-specific DNA-methyltransferase (cytosine-N4-specific)